MKSVGTQAMQKLDLSLDIPGAPIVRQAPPEPELEGLSPLDLPDPFGLALEGHAPAAGADTGAGASVGQRPVTGREAVSQPLRGGTGLSAVSGAEGGGRRRPHLRAVPAPLALVTPHGAASAPTAPARPPDNLRSPRQGAAGEKVAGEKADSHGAQGAPRDGQAPGAHAQEVIVSPEDAQVRQKVLSALRDLQPSETSTVPAAATMGGDLVCKSIRVQGELCGSVKATGLVYLEDGAVLNGRILDAEIVILAGTVSADVNQVAVRCSGMVVLAQSARVVGHIQCRAVAIYEGACLVGTVQCLPSPQA